MTKNAFIPNFWKIYNMIWKAGLPFLKGNLRLAPTFDRRIPGARREAADLWIQAASAGEAFLAVAILRDLDPPAPLKVLATTTTDQGFDILEKASPGFPPTSPSPWTASPLTCPMPWKRPWTR